MEGFRHCTTIQVRFKDVDAMGHVNNANHFTYFELARVNYFDEVIAEEIDWQKQGIILAKMSIDYKSPIFMKDKVTVWCRVSRFGTTSFDCEYRIMCLRNGCEILAATGLSTQVCFDYINNKPYPVPETWKTRAQQFDMV
jgi:acyl-CoA thioester hydrolase